MDHNKKAQHEMASWASHTYIIGVWEQPLKVILGHPSHLQMLAAGLSHLFREPAPRTPFIYVCGTPRICASTTPLSMMCPRIIF